MILEALWRTYWLLATMLFAFAAVVFAASAISAGDTASDIEAFILSVAVFGMAASMYRIEKLNQELKEFNHD